MQSFTARLRAAHPYERIKSVWSQPSSWLKIFVSVFLPAATVVAIILVAVRFTVWNRSSSSAKSTPDAHEPVINDGPQCNPFVSSSVCSCDGAGLISDFAKISGLVMDIRAENANATGTNSLIQSIRDASGKNNSLKGYSSFAGSISTPTLEYDPSINAYVMLFTGRQMLISANNHRPLNASAFTLCATVSLLSITPSGQCVMGTGDAQPWCLNSHGDGDTAYPFLSTQRVGVSPSLASRSYLSSFPSGYRVVCASSGGSVDQVVDPLFRPTVIQTGITVDGTLSNVSTVVSTDNAAGLSGLVTLGGVSANARISNGLYGRVKHVVAYNRLLSVYERSAVENSLLAEIGRSAKAVDTYAPAELMRWDMNNATLRYDTSLGEAVVEQPSAVWDPSSKKWYVFYSAWNSTLNSTYVSGWINYASGRTLDLLVKNNGRAFERDTNAAGWSSGWVTSPSLLWHNESSLWYMYFLGSRNTSYTAQPQFIGYATSPSLNGTWTRSVAPLLKASDPWELYGSTNALQSGIGRPCIVRNGTQFILFYVASTRQNATAPSGQPFLIQQVGMATSLYPDRGFNKSAYNPVIRVAPSSFLSQSSVSATLAQTMDEYYMYDIHVSRYKDHFIGFVSVGVPGVSAKYGVSMLVKSYDLVHWTRHPVLGSGYTGFINHVRLVLPPPPQVNGTIRILADDGGSFIYSGTQRKDTVTQCVKT